MLLLVDLDNTLSDRAGSLEAWARSYPAERSRRVDEQLLARDHPDRWGRAAPEE